MPHTEDSPTRSIEDIDEILSLAKLSEEDILSTSQTIYFAENNLHENQYQLLELDKNLMQCLESGGTLFIKGEDDDNAVLCTDSKTYNLQLAETSNSLLLAENLKRNTDLSKISERNVSKVTINRIFGEYLEATPSKPHLNKLKNLLEKTVYRGQENESEVNEEDLLSYDQILTIVQSSKDELKTSLKTMNTISIDGKIRILDFEYHFRVLSYMLKLIEENSWGLDEIDYEETMNALSDIVPADILNNLFDLYAEEAQIIDGLQLYKYNEVKVCRFFAQVLLCSAGRFNLDEFLQAWKESVPEGMIATEDMLHGVAIVDRKSVPNVIWAFQEESLPENINERFRMLFDVKEKWTVHEIAPYIQNLTTEKFDVNALLAKHARASTVQGVKYYSSKHSH